MKKNILVSVVFLSVCFFAIGRDKPTDNGSLGPIWLDCNYLEDPQAIDTEIPKLSWINQYTQTAYQIVVATEDYLLDENEADVWNSGKVYSTESNLVKYRGPKLESMKDYYWAVRIWDDKDIPSNWSSAAKWTTGIMPGDSWKADWISAPWIKFKDGEVYSEAPMFRKEFTVGKGLKSAKAFISGLGFFEMSVNGEKTGDDFYVPGFTDYTKRPGLAASRNIQIDPEVTAYRTLYLGYDITEQVKKGKNAVGVLLGNGYYHSYLVDRSKLNNFGAPKLICQIVLTYEDGHQEFVCSDTSWKVIKSPIEFNDLYEGEVYNANKEIKGWNMPGLDDSSWEDAVPADRPDGKLTACMGPTDKVTETISPVTFKKLENGNYHVDFGKEISGRILFTGIKAEKGDTLRIRHINEYPSPRCEYIFANGKKVTFGPRFDWYVFKEAEISGIENLKPENLVAEAINTNVPINSTFECSNDLFMQINQIWRRSQLDNMHCAVASDCPHRERLPYTGDGQVAMETVLYNFDASSFYNKWIGDVRGSQNPESGYVPNSAPWIATAGGGPEWGAAICVMPWEFFLRYGDYDVLKENLDAMRGYLKFYGSWKREDGSILVQKRQATANGEPFYWLNLGDWAPSFQNPQEALVHTFYYWLCAVNTSKAAHMLGEEEIACHYEDVARETWEAFHKAFYNETEKSYGDFGSNIYALYMGVPEEHYQDVKASLKNELEVKYNRHLNTGIFGTKFLFEVLSMNGMGDLAYDIMNQRDFPSYGNWIEQGATTTWEQWNGTDSRNHPMFGGGLTWFYHILAGVGTDPNEPGFKHIIIKPMPVSQLAEVSYSTDTRYGRVTSKVSHKNGVVKMEGIIPVGCHATVYVPKSLEAVKNAPLSDESYEIYEVGSGEYSFNAE